MIGLLGCFKIIVPAGILTALIACGSSDSQPLTQVFGAVATQLTSDGTAARDARAQLTPEIVAGVTEPFLLVDVPARQASATFAVFARSQNRTDWRGADGISIVVADDFVVATRGLGADLFLADPGGLRAALSSGSGRSVRRHTRLDGENREVKFIYNCLVQTDGFETIDQIDRKIVSKKITEICESDLRTETDFSNSYWIGAVDGLVWQSEQWVSPDVGHLKLTNLRR